MSVLLRGVRLYGEGERVDVLVDDGQIADIGDLEIPDTADVIDATGHVLLRIRRPAHPSTRAWPRIRRGHRNRLGGSGFRWLHGGVRDG